MDVTTQTLVALLSCKSYVPLVGTHFLSQSNDNPESFILAFSTCFQTSTKGKAKLQSAQAEWRTEVERRCQR